MRTDAAVPSTGLSSRLGRAVALSLAVLAVLAPTASAALSFGNLGSGAGQTNEPTGVAVDDSSGRVYVADAGNNRVDVFSAAGEFLLAFGWGVADGTTAVLQTCGPAATPPSPTCFAGIPGSGDGQLERPFSIAVDNDPA